MKVFHLAISAYLSILLLGCTTMEPAATPPTKPAKDPISVTFYNHGKKPIPPYQVVGKGTVSKFNLVGIKRQEASIQDAMRKMAVAMGGDAVINITHDEQTVSGTVIAYKSSAKIATHNQV